MFTLLKKIPVEIYTLLAPVILLSVFFEILNIISPDKISLLDVLDKLVSSVLILGGHKMFLAISALWVLTALISVVYLVKDNINEIKKIIWPMCRSLVFLNLLTALLSFFLGFSTVLLTKTVDVNTVAEATLYLDKLERFVFGGIPAFSLIGNLSSSVLEVVLFLSYSYLYLIFPVALIMVIFKNKKIFRSMIISFFLAFIISLPIFFLIPSTSPDGLYAAKIFQGLTVPANPVDNFDNSFLPYLNYFHTIWISDENEFINVTSVPSLHAAWGLIAVLGIIKAKYRISSLIFSIWYILMLVGAFYFLQHYLLDLVAGIILGLSAFHLAGTLIKKENLYYNGKDWFIISDLLIEIKEKAEFVLRNLWGRLLNSEQKK